MATFLEQCGLVVTEILDIIPQISSAIIASPVLSVGLGIFILGGAIGVFGRLISRS